MTHRQARTFGRDSLTALSNGERIVAESIVEGLTKSEIAQRTGLSEQAVNKHLSQVLNKLDVRTRSDLVLRLHLRQWQLLPQEAPKSAKFLLLLLVPRSSREHLVGDLEEEYRTVVLPQYGARKARLWYWWQVISSVVPVLWAQLRRLIGLVLLFRSVQ
jgi:DNA-binding CsgD family transcriptional regulator